MKFYTQREYVEIFHLLFLVQLGRKVDKKRYALKGGCNLKFFFNSPRYSEDIDLDVNGISEYLLKERVDKILSSSAFNQILQIENIEIEHITVHKQTHTTQRWKLGLITPVTNSILPTKIEFSRRGMDKLIEFSAVHPAVIRHYQLSPLMLSHYTKEGAFMQKFGALVDRSVTQARDIFDLYILFFSGIDTGMLDDDIAERAEEAKEKILSMQFADFNSQVVAYLPPEDQRQYNSEEIWDNIRLEVANIVCGGRL